MPSVIRWCIARIRALVRRWHRDRVVPSTVGVRLKRYTWRGQERYRIYWRTPEDVAKARATVAGRTSSTSWPMTSATAI